MEAWAELHHRAPMCNVAVHAEETPNKCLFSCEFEQLKESRENGFDTSAHLHCNSSGEQHGSVLNLAASGQFEKEGSTATQ